MYGTRVTSFESRRELLCKVADKEISQLATPLGGNGYMMTFTNRKKLICNISIVHLLGLMLSSDPDLRPSAEECLNHPYFVESEVSIVPLQSYQNGI
jgi:serine/threonine protein kinase